MNKQYEKFFHENGEELIRVFFALKWEMDMSPHPHTYGKTCLRCGILQTAETLVLKIIKGD